MAEEQSTQKAPVKAAEPEERVTRREQPADKTGQAASRRQEEGHRRGNGPTTARQAELAAVASYDDLVELNRAGMDATLRASEAMLKATSSLAEELTSFACQRLRTDVETARSLIESGNDWNKAIARAFKYLMSNTRKIGAPIRQSGDVRYAIAIRHRPVNRSGYAWPTGTLRPEELQYGCEEAAGAASGRSGSQAGRARLRPRALASERRCRRARLAQGTTVRHSRGVALGSWRLLPLRGEKPYSLIP